MRPRREAIAWFRYLPQGTDNCNTEHDRCPKKHILNPSLANLLQKTRHGITSCLPCIEVKPSVGEWTPSRSSEARDCGAHGCNQTGLQHAHHTTTQLGYITSYVSQKKKTTKINQTHKIFLFEIDNHF